MLAIVGLSGDLVNGAKLGGDNFDSSALEAAENFSDESRLEILVVVSHVP